jgi:hypothetical protein
MTQAHPVDQRAFMDIVELAADDVAGLNRGILGIAVIAILKDGDEMAVQVGASVPPEIVRMAVTMLANRWGEGGPEAFTTLSRRKPRAAA